MISRRMTHRIALPALALLALSLAGCSSVKRELGVGRNSPDEFAVVKRAPLTLPPDYALRPPSSDHAPPATEVTQQARSALMGERQPVLVKTGAAESAFLQKAGAQNANPDIRSTINRDNGYIALQNRTVAEKLIFWGDGDKTGNLETAPASIVDAKAEAARLKQNQADGKAANDGKVPVIEKQKSTLEKIF